jgi:hypothetical protein
VHELRSTIFGGERSVSLAEKASDKKPRGGDGSLTAIKIRREESRRCNQRSEHRHVNAIDQATIRYRKRQYDVPVLNLSSRGAMIACDLRPALGARIDIRFADCNATACSVRWVRDGRIGLEFDKETLVIGANDVAAPLVSGRREGERPTIAVRKQRPPRHASMLRAELHWPNGSMPVRLRNISAGGAMLQAGQDLDPYSKVVLEIPNTAAIAGRVRWCRSKLIGIHFNDDFDLDALTRAEAPATPAHPGFVKPDYLASETDPNSWASRSSGLRLEDL